MTTPDKKRREIKALKLNKKANKALYDFIKKYDLKATKKKDGTLVIHVKLEPIKK